MARTQAAWVTGVALLVGAATSFGQANNSAKYHYYYFDQPLEIDLDASEVAVFTDRNLAVAGQAARLDKFGIADGDIRTHAVPGISMAKTPLNRATEVGVKALTDEISREEGIQFVSPKFIDDRGLPLLVTRDLLIGFRSDVSADQVAAIIAQSNFGEIVELNFGGMPNVYRVRSSSRDGFVVLRQANELAVRPDVDFAEPDMMSTGVLHLIPNDPRFTAQWGLHNTGGGGGQVNMDMDGPEAWDVTTGSSSILVAILDDGIEQDHPDIHQVPGEDFTGNGTGGDHLNVCDRHGTAVGGCVSAMINNATGGTGIAPDARVVSTKVFIANTNPCSNFGNVQNSWVVNALSYAENNGVRVTNTSLGFGPSGSVTNKYTSTRAAGLIHFISAGNDGSTTIGYPASIPAVNSIAALHRSGSIASFSTHGVGLDFIAPGEDIWSTDRTGDDGYSSGDEAVVSGTSFASPYSAGVAALVLSVDSTQTPDDVEGILQLTVLDLGDTGYDTTYGHGLLKAGQAVQFASPSNQTCAEAVQVACNTSASFFNTQVDNPASPAFSCGIGAAHDGALWLKFTATATSARIATCDSDAPDSTFAVYSGTCGQLTPIACSENGDCSTTSLAGQCLTGLNIGETYYVQLASQTTAERGLYRVGIECSCLGACCGTPPLAACASRQEANCLAIGGSFGGPDVDCEGDLDGNGIDDGCDVLNTEFSQIPTADEESVDSNWDRANNIPATVVTDDFVADGRPISAVRWWGRHTDGNVIPDGWFLGFHEPLAALDPAGEAIGLYFCDASVVSRTATSIEECAAASVFQYEASLIDCCRLVSNADSRSGLFPAISTSFQADECVEYDLSIQSIVGQRFIGGGCTPQATANSAPGAFWNWLTTGQEKGSHAALEAPSNFSGGDWLFGPWSAMTLACGNTNQAFEVLSTTHPGAALLPVWNNGGPNGHNALNSQSGGQLSDFMTVDDFQLASPATFNRIEFLNEEEGPFMWSGRVRIEIYPDNGSGAPNASGGPTVVHVVPDNGGSVTRIPAGPGLLADRYAYRIDNVGIPLGAGLWWLGLATAGQPATNGQAYWCTSHTHPDPFFFGGETHLRAPSAGIPNFVTWDSLLLGSNRYDGVFSLSFTEAADCNCNGVADDEDIAQSTSEDCNPNGIPDECEYDCNGNGSPDDCDVRDLVSQDCNTNGVPDECDVFLGTEVDANDNQVPDQCECGTSAPLAEPSAVAKNRYISFEPGNAGENVAIRVRFVNLDRFGAFNNQVRWVGAPSNCNECSGPAFAVAQLQCTPHFRDWGGISLLDVYGPAVVPNSTYDVQVIHENCSADLEDELSYSAPLTVTTQEWGDVVLPFSGASQPNFSDVSAAVDCFRCIPAAVRKVRCQMQPNTPNPCGTISFSDISNVVDGFRGFVYPFAGPTTCQ